MIKAIVTLTSVFPVGLRKVSLSIFALLLLAATASSQSSTDGTTPPALTPGAPAGSYSLSGFESVNLFNGNLEFHLPLLSIGGRGSARTGLMLNIQERWRVEAASPCGNCGVFYYPTYNWWSRLELGYGPGFMDYRHVYEGDDMCDNDPSRLQMSLLRFTFTMPDGTEMEFRDRQTGGAPLEVYICRPPGPSRGRVFVTSDGTSAIYITDTEVFDHGLWGLSGVMILKDGTRYDISGSGLVTAIRDRNGNKITFEYNLHQRVKKITDSLNRIVSFKYDQNAAPYGPHDEITFTGFNNITRKIRVSKAALQNIFPPGSNYQVRTSNSLFPQLSGTSVINNPFNPDLTSKVWLPDGRTYSFFYNEYAELARVVLPTGGAIEYKWGSGVQGAPASGVVLGEIYRRILERRLYPDGATGYPDNDAIDPYQLKTTYSKQEQMAASGQSTVDLGFVQVMQLGTSGVLLAQSKHYFHGYASSPVGNPLTPGPPPPIYYVPWRYGKENKTEQLNEAGAVWQRVRRTWTQRQPIPSWWEVWASARELNIVNDAPSNDPRLTESKTELTDLSPVLIAKQTFEYDEFNNQTAVTEFDYNSGADPTIPVRRTETDFIRTEGQLDYISDQIHIVGLPKEQRVFGYNASGQINSAPAAKTQFYYDQTLPADCPGVIGWQDPGTAARGNLTATHKWVNSTNGWIINSNKYDEVGNVVESTDGRGNTSLIQYSNASFAYAFPSLMQTPSVNIGETSQRLDTQYTCDFASGLITSMTDQNGFITTYEYNDPLDRLTRVVRPLGGGQTEYFYGDSIGTLFLRTRTSLDGSRSIESHQYFNGLGRPKRSFNSEGGQYVAIDTEYDGLGRALRVSNPYRTSILNDPSINPSGKWTTYSYDPLGRVKTITTPDQAVVMSEYERNEVKVTDQAGKKRNSTSDALGRLIKVVEDPSGLNYSTTYGYDVLDNLLTVTQGAQTRTFTHDSLSRLKTASNPEYNAGASYRYTYDANSNLFTRTDPRGVVTTYTYDSLNRVTKREYSTVAGVSATPTVNYKYDTATNGKGKLAEVTYGSGDGSFYGGYDEMGRLTSSSQKTDGQSYGFSYAYDLAGNLTSQTYPSGKIVATEYDDAGRIAGVREGARYYTGAASSDSINRIQYAPHGAIEAMKLGNQLWEHTVYNDRLQPAEIGLGTSSSNSSLLKLELTYGTTNNNGNILTQKIIAGSLALSQCYTYDNLNRLSFAEEKAGAACASGSQVWRQTYDYDRFGNRAVRVGSLIPSSQLTPQSASGSDLSAFNQATNRLARDGFSYDAAGNQTADPTTGNNGFVYDAENRLTSKAGVSSYVYDGDGRRVKKTANNVTTVMVYNAQGQLIAEYGGQAPAQSQTSYVTTDHLGSTRVVTGQNQAVKARYDYLPFGEEVATGLGGRGTVSGYNNTDKTRQKFTSKERDNESGLDYFKARYYSSAQGRFTSPDPHGPWSMSEDEKAAFLSTPQQWNRFAYVMNNPHKYIDPNGLEVYDPDTVDEDTQKRIHDALVEISKHGNRRQRAIANFILNNDVLIKTKYDGGTTGGDTTISDPAAASEAIQKGWISTGTAASYITLTVSLGATRSDAPERVAHLESVLVHEGNHVLSFARTISTLSAAQGMNAVVNPTKYSLEGNALLSQADYLLRRGGVYHQVGQYPVLGYSLLQNEGGKIKINEARIRDMLRVTYNVTQDNPGPTTTQRFPVLRQPRR